MKKWLLAGMILFSTAANCAEVMSRLTGEELLKLCDGPAPDESACTAYVIGVIDGIASYIATSAEVDNTTPLKLWCLSSITANQMRLVVIKYLKNHPEGLHFAAASTVATAISMNFPCK